MTSPARIGDALLSAVELLSFEIHTVEWTSYTGAARRVTITPIAVPATTIKTASHLYRRSAAIPRVHEIRMSGSAETGWLRGYAGLRTSTLPCARERVRTPRA